LKTFIAFFFPALLIYFFITHKPKPSTGELLAESLHDEKYLAFDSTAFDSVFSAELKNLSAKYVNIHKLKAYYASTGNQPILINKYLSNNGIDTLLSYLKTSGDHGFNPNIFHTSGIEQLIKKLRENDFSSVKDSYSTISRLEILSADALVRYTSYLKYGAINPKEIFSRYFIDVKRADSFFIPNLLNAVNIVDTLSSLQGKSAQYKALQEKYLNSKNDSIKKVLLINMERLRWVLPDVGKQFIQVNIPDFRLVFFDGKDTLTAMKVCVGGPKDLDYDAQYKVFEKTGDIKDRPENRETPMLFSNIKKLYTNPVWNIPESIAQTEVYTMIRRSSNYLKRKNIAVYYKNKKIENPSTIRWYKYDRSNFPFLFVQQPSSDNSLGRLKFIFPNSSSVYLHDTNFKQGFKLKNRAISHGCIRVENPLKLAELLVVDTAKYDSIRKELRLKPLRNYAGQPVSSFKAGQVPQKDLAPVRFSPKAETPILVTYFTAWSENNKIEYRPDIYKLDEKLWAAMKKYRL